MVKEAYVGFETAKLLKEKGFDGGFHKYYWGYEEGKEFLTEGSFNSEYDYPAPTQQMAMRWLREVHKLEIYPFHYKKHPKNKWGYDIKKEMPLSVIDKFQKLAIFDSYEDAAEAAIQYCLINLI